MSYCRFSSDDHQCDVYVYEHFQGFWAIHVAASKIRPPVETRPAPIAGDWWSRGSAGIEEFSARERAVEAWLASALREPINLPHDGASFEEPTAADAADRLEALRVAGYQVPQYALDALRTEAAEAAERREIGNG